jgi:hypothetical protein
MCVCIGATDAPPNLPNLTGEANGIFTYMRESPNASDLRSAST